jgi:hypothetical protein
VMWLLVDEGTHEETTCTDTPNWGDDAANTCGTYKGSKFCTASGGYGTGWKDRWGEFDDYAVSGVSALEACCACGGGRRQEPELMVLPDRATTTSSSPREENLTSKAVYPWCPRTRKEDCTWSKCCRDAGMQCYEKNQYWSTCQVSCTPGIDPRDPPNSRQPWTCRQLGQRTPGEARTTTTRTTKTPFDAIVIRQDMVGQPAPAILSRQRPWLSFGPLATSIASAIVALLLATRCRSVWSQYRSVALDVEGDIDSPAQARQGTFSALSMGEVAGAEA